MQMAKPRWTELNTINHPSSDREHNAAPRLELRDSQLDRQTWEQAGPRDTGVHPETTLATKTPFRLLRNVPIKLLR